MLLRSSRDDGRECGEWSADDAACAPHGDGTVDAFADAGADSVSSGGVHGDSGADTKSEPFADAGADAANT